MYALSDVDLKPYFSLIGGFLERQHTASVRKNRLKR